MCEGNGGCLTECDCDDSYNYKGQHYKQCKCNNQEHYLSLLKKLFLLTFPEKTISFPSKSSL
jgi:hypothetical protein